MSEAVFTNLPRFDAGNDPHLSDQLRMLNRKSVVGEVTTSTRAEGAVDTIKALEDDLHGSEPQVEASTEPSSIDTLLAALSDTMDRLESENRKHMVDSIQSLAAELFPQLSDLFLVDEIGRHLPELVPKTVPTLEIRAEPELAKQLCQMIERTDTLNAACKVTHVETSEDTSVNVSWQTGGLIFNFDTLLNACMAKLKSTQNH